VHDCIRRALETCRADARRKGVALELNLRAKDHHAWVDGARVQQVFWNLVNNAVKFTPTGGRVRVTSDNAEGRLRVRVEDTGIGIEPGTLPRLFRPFEQGEQTKLRRFGGLGLGLTIAKSLVELHDGRLTAFSEGKGKGTTFTVELGTAAPEPKPAAPEPPVEVSDAGSWHILLVEDDPDTMRIMSRLLKRMGYVVGSADSVRAALEMAAREHYDLLISDLGLPDGSGLDVMREIRRRYGLKGLAISGYGTDEDIRESREAGFQQLLTKPVTVGRLESAVREMTAVH
jgi:CheY-like chemotaxis protein